jgi:hypothetical protein
MHHQAAPYSFTWPQWPRPNAHRAPSHYRDYNTLVKLPALDEGDAVNYTITLIMCGILFDNSRSTGWFAPSDDGSNV